MNAGPDRSRDNFFGLIKTTARHSAVYGLFDFIGKATQLVLVPLYTHVMTPDDYGLLEIFVAATPLLLIVLVLGLNSALVRYHTTADSEEEGRRYFRTAFTVVFAFSAVIWALLCLAVPLLAKLDPGAGSGAESLRRALNEPGLWRLLVSAAALDAVGTMFLALFRSQSRPFRYSWVNLARFISILGLNVVLVGVLKLGARGVLTGNLIGAGLGAALGLALCLRDVGFEWHGRHFRRLAGFGFPLVLSGIALSFVMSNADRYFLAASSSLHETGIYSLGYRVGMIMSMLVNAFVVAWPPMMFRIAKDPDAPHIFSRVLTYYLLVTGFAWLLVSSFSNEIVGLVATPDFAAAGDVVWLILLSYLMQGVYYIMSLGVMLTDRTGWIPVVIVSSALLNLAANAVLIPRFGMHGAAWATLISYVFLAAFMRSVGRRYYKVLMERKRVAAIAVFAAAIVLINRAWIGHAGATDVLLKVGMVALFPAALFATRFFHEEELVRLRAFLGRAAGGSRRS